MPTASAIMLRSANLLNDQIRSVYTDAVLLPYLNMALDELQEVFEEHNIAATNETSVVINIPTSASGAIVVRSPGGPPSYPIDLIEIQQIWERAQGVNPFIPMTRVDFLPHDMETPINQLIYFAWIDEEIRFLPTNASNDIKIDYIKSLFVEVTSGATNIALTNCMSYLAYRTAGLASEFIGENTTRAEALNSNALLSIERSLNINIKGGQVMPVRRRPFMQGYKNRGGSLMV